MRRVLPLRVIERPPTPPPRRRAVDIIWNITKICPWDCPGCCVDADHVCKHDHVVQVRFHGLRESTLIEYNPAFGSAYDAALLDRQRRGLELTYQQKLAVLDHLDGFTTKIDFSGGDPLCARENYDVLQIASSR